MLATTHSPELLEHRELRADEILAVQSVEGRTVLAPVDEASRSALGDKLYTGGELLRTGFLQPDVSQDRARVRIFEPWRP